MTKVRILYNPDSLMTNAPFGAHPQRSVDAFVRLAEHAIEMDGYEPTFEENDQTSREWAVVGKHLSILQRREIDNELLWTYSRDWHIITGPVENPAQVRY